MSAEILVDLSGHRWERKSDDPQTFLIQTTRRNAPAVWRLVAAADVVFAPSGQLPRPGEPLTRLQRLRPFPLMVVTDTAILYLGTARLFARANQGKDFTPRLQRPS